MLDGAIDWFGSLGERFGVDPLVYAILYIGAAPLFFGSLAWLVHRVRRGERPAAPVVSAAFFFSLPALYVIVAGRNLPAWVYVVLLGLAVIGAISAVRRVRDALRRSG